MWQCSSEALACAAERSGLDCGVMAPSFAGLQWLSCQAMLSLMASRDTWQPMEEPCGRAAAELWLCSHRRVITDRSLIAARSMTPSCGATSRSTKRRFWCTPTTWAPSSSWTSVRCVVCSRAAQCLQPEHRSDNPAYHDNYLNGKFTRVMVDAAAHYQSARPNTGNACLLQGLRGHSVVLMGKNTMMKRSMRLYIEETGDEKWASLVERMVGNVGLIFTKGDLSDVREQIKSFQVWFGSSLSSFFG